MRRCFTLLAGLLMTLPLAPVNGQTPTAEVRERQLTISITQADALAEHPPMAERAAELSAQRLNAFLEQYRAERMPSHPSRWSLELDYRPGAGNSHWSTLVERGYEYTGGAHGMPIEQRHTWLADQQRWANIEDVLAEPEAYQAVADFVHSVVLARRLQRDRSVDPESLQAWQQALDAGAPAEPSAWQQFELLAQGQQLKALRFIIPSYVIGPFAEGVHVIDMPAYLLEPWLAEAIEPVAAPRKTGLVRRWGHFQPEQPQAVWRDCDAETPDAALARVHMSATVASEVDRLLADGAKRLFIDGLWRDEQHLVGALRIEVEGHGCGLDLAGLEFRAHGNEPFWAVSLGDDWLEWLEPGSQPQRMAIIDQTGKHQWQLDGGEQFSVMALPCRDSMSGTYFAYTALLQSSDGMMRSGCAVPGSTD